MILNTCWIISNSYEGARSKVSSPNPGYSITKFFLLFWNKWMRKFHCTKITHLRDWVVWFEFLYHLRYIIYQKPNPSKFCLNRTSELEIFYLEIIYWILPSTIVNIWFFIFFLTHYLVPISWNIPFCFKMLSSSFETHFQVICEGVTLTIWAKSKFKIISEIIKLPTSYSDNDSLGEVAWWCDS